MKFMGRIKTKELFLGLIPFIVLLALWIFSIQFGWMPKWFLPSPMKVWDSFVHLFSDGTVVKILSESMINLVPPYFLAISTSFILGVLIGTSTTAKKIFFPFIATLYPIPSLAWLPFMIILFGFTRETVWILLFISTFLKMIYNMISGVRNVNPIWILAAKNLGLSKFQIIIHVIIPGALPDIMTAVRIGFGSIWRSVVATEMLVSGAGGLGKFIWTAQWSFSFEKIFVGIFLIAVISILFETFIFKRIEAKTLEKWGVVQGDEE